MKNLYQRFRFPPSIIRHTVWRYNRTVAPLFSLVVWIVLAGISIGSAQVSQGTTDGEWRAYGADKAGTKYSPLDQIDRANFSDLKIAWRWQSVDGFLSKTTANGGEWWSSAMPSSSGWSRKRRICIASRTRRTTRVLRPRR